MQEYTQNTFDKGIIKDLSNYNQNKQTLTDCVNCEFTTHTGNEGILQNNQGNMYIEQLPDGYIPLCTQELNGIVYYVLAQYDKTTLRLTGRGELGTFPSPDYSNTRDLNSNTKITNLTNIYRPLNNYFDETISTDPTESQIADLNNYGRFNSAAFNFDTTGLHLCELELQMDYDGSVNMIFTDNFNPIRMVNTRFSLQADREVWIIDRIGTKDNNLYNFRDWNNKLNHILTNTLLPVIKLESINVGGQLSPGNYKYYIRYGTGDSQVTDVVAESFTVMVLHGDTVATTRGGDEPSSITTSDRTNKSVTLRIQNINQSYSYIRLYYVYNFGSVTNNKKAVEVDAKYIITNGELLITHTGYETELDYDINELSVTYASIKTAKTITQLQSRLFIANITSTTYDYTQLSNYAKTISLRHNLQKLHVIGTNSTVGLDDIYQVQINTTALPSTLNTTGYIGGYYNPHNIYNNLGYWFGEAYAFGIVYILSDGTLSPVFPVSGINDEASNQTYTFNLNDPNQPFGPTPLLLGSSGENINGVYKFPKRTNDGFRNNIYDLSSIAAHTHNFDNGALLNTDGTVKIMGITFNIPANPPANTIGCMFVRADRNNKDVLSQGYLTNTMHVPNTTAIAQEDCITCHDSTGNAGDLLWNWGSNPSYSSFLSPGNNTGYTRANSKLIPTIGFYLDMNMGYRADSGADSNRRCVRAAFAGPDGEGAEHYLGMVHYNVFWTPNEPATVSGFCEYGRNYAFISPDIIVNQNKYLQVLNGTNFNITPLCYVDYIGDIQTYQYDINQPASPTNLSLFKTISQHGATGSLIPLTLSYANSSVDFVNQEQNTAFANYFGGSAFFTARIKQDGPQGCAAQDQIGFAFNAFKYESYAGIRIPLGINLMDLRLVDSPPEHSGEFLRNTNYYNRRFDNHSVVVNIRNPSALPIENKYNITLNKYTPISDRLYWIKPTNYAYDNFLWDSLNDSQTITLNKTYWNGDNFTSVSFRRLYTNLLSEDTTINSQYIREAKNKVGYSLTLVTESNENIAARNTFFYDINEGIRRSYLPRYTNNTTIDVFTDLNLKNNTWRAYSLLETTANNQGISQIDTDKQNIALDPTLPFIQTQFDTRIMYSDVYVRGSFNNGYRSILPQYRQDYDRSLGEIVSIKEYNNNILMVQEKGVSIVAINPRGLVNTEGGAGSIFVQGIGVLYDKPQSISTEYGSTWQFSICKTDNSVYGVDIRKNKLWQIKGGVMILISDYKIQIFLLKIKDLFLINNPNTVIYFSDIRTYWDKYKGSIIFTFYAKDYDRSEISWCDPCCVDGINCNAPTNPLNCKIVSITKMPTETKAWTVVYHEETEVWLTYHTYYPLIMYNVFNKLYSHNLFNNSEIIWQHHSLVDTIEINGQFQQIPIYNNYYGEQFSFELEFIVNDKIDSHKIFSNLIILANEVPPDKIHYSNDNERAYYYQQPNNVYPEPAKTVAVQTVRPRFRGKYGLRGSTNPMINVVYKANQEYRENKHYITITKDTNDNLDTNVPSASTFDNNRLIRDRFVKIRFIYNTSDYVTLQAIITKYLTSAS